MSVGAAPSTRRDEIVALAGELFAARGFAATTVREIADAAGILSGSLYHHFESKEAIVEALLRRFLDDILASYRRIVAEREDPVATMRALVHEAFDALRTNRAALAVMLNEYSVLIGDRRFSFLRDAAEDTEAIWTAVLVAGIEARAFRADIDAGTMYRFMRDAIWISVRWYQPEGPRTPDEIADDYLAVMLEGIAP